MEQNQFKRRTFNELDWFNPTTWFGQPSVAPPAYTGVSQDEKSAGLPGWKTSSNTSVSSAFKNEFVKPFTNTEKTVVNDVKSVEKSIVNIAETVEQDLKYIGTEIFDGGKWIVKETEIIGNDVVIASKGAFNIASKTIIFIETYYPFILFGVGSYIGARYINELKQAVA